MPITNVTRANCLEVIISANIAAITNLAPISIIVSTDVNAIINIVKTSKNAIIKKKLISTIKEKGCVKQT